ncbi:hypothetical protein BSU04_07225 [Caballeronia sordidicola]|uniref:Uncharacterized protein n=1 Tax=Caballeronia sordidicola TaxID=196367 RepID=A0A226WU91_CABSO|nr:hypothetical protein BSU04_30045 [Caballeronia sordidicola]OXC79467.1 hypothetical protein BSU04_07225 [Caballeronia sordidicola]
MAGLKTPAHSDMRQGRLSPTALSCAAAAAAIGKFARRLL